MKNTKRRFRLALALAVCLALVVTIGAAAAPWVIDAFDTSGPTISLMFPTAGTKGGSGSAPGGIGGERDVLVTASATTANDVYGFRVETDGGASKMVITSGSSVKSNTRLIWDGAADTDEYTIDVNGLGGVDLVDGTNDGFHIEVINSDVRVQVIMHVWEMGGNEATASFYIQPTITIEDHVDFFVPFASFTPTLDFTNVGAIMLEIDATITPGSDIEIDFLGADNSRDFGDAPNSYGAVSHIANGLRLGGSVDIEPLPLYSPAANGDDLDQDPPNDEDGVSRTPDVKWFPTGTASLDVTVAGCQQAACYVNGWVDWNKDGVFQPDERVLDDITYPNGSFSGAVFPNLTFPIPDYMDLYAPLLARFRICNAANVCDTPIGEVAGGEVEDYAWSFGPTAVTLTELSARSTLSTGALAAIGAAGMLALAAVYAALKLRRQT